MQTANFKRRVDDGKRYILSNGLWHQVTHPGDGSLEHVRTVVKRNEVAVRPSFRFSWFRKEKKKEEESKGIMTIADIKARVPDRALDAHYEDAEYYPAVDVSRYLAQARKYKIHKMEYVYPWRDCGDFSYMFQGVIHLDYDLGKTACFIEWWGYQKNGKAYAHAFNSVVNWVGHLPIEPQQCKVFSIPADWYCLMRTG